ncbi:MAG: thermonuclease family protein [Anaerolineae bacterium]|nr:thermonuclease family protein [Anaerolineae bacterium]
MNDLQHVYQRIAADRADFAVQLEQLEQERAELIDQAAGEVSARLRTALARRISNVDARLSGLRSIVEALQLQARLLAQLVYARETGDRPDQGLLARVDWEALLVSVDQWRAVEASMLEKLRWMLDLLGMPPEPPAAAEPGVEWAAVAHVPDGDGVNLADGRRVRYVGIDAPEVAAWGRPDEPFAQEARVLNERLVAGRRLRLERDVSDADRYGRLLRYVYVGETMVNAEIVRAGLARAFCVPPDERHAALFERLEREAQRRRRGIWHSLGIPGGR